MPVISRTVTVHNKEGQRLRSALWGKPRLWRRKKTNEENIKDAITHALQLLKQQKLGSIVYVNNIPIWNAKFGLDGSYYIAWKSNPTAEYWKRKV